MNPKKVMIKWKGEMRPLGSILDKDRCRLLLGLLIEREDLKKQLQALTPVPELNDK